MPKKYNWSVYRKHYNTKWESEPLLREWVRSVQSLIKVGGGLRVYG